jgi:hypothetical protein
MPDHIAERRRFRPCDWINTKTMQPIYAIQARVGKNGWAHIFKDGKPMFFDREADRDAKLKELAATEAVNEKA